MNSIPTIRPSADLRSSYNEISDYCHEYSKPVFITKDGKGNLAVMSIEAYEQLKGRYELYSLLEQGLEDERRGKASSFLRSTCRYKKKDKLPISII